MPEEYFIRGPEEETANGPYNIDALLTLAEAGRITPEHYYFDPRMESWATIRSNQPLFGQVFPEKKQLTLRKKTAEEIKSLNVDQSAQGAIRVEDMLAAAEGHTKETHHVRQRRLWRERAANLSVPILGILLLASALSVLYPSWSIIDGILNETEGAYQTLFQKPVVFLGLLDLLLGIFLLLNATEVFPLIRFRALLGAGFFCVIYAAGWINGDPHGLWMALSSLLFGLGLYACTLTLYFPLMVVAASAGAAGIAGILWFSNILPLLAGS